MFIVYVAKFTTTWGTRRVIVGYTEKALAAREKDYNDKGASCPSFALPASASRGGVVLREVGRARTRADALLLELLEFGKAARAWDASRRRGETGWRGHVRGAAFPTPTLSEDDAPGAARVVADVQPEWRLAGVRAAAARWRAEHPVVAWHLAVPERCLL